MGKGVGIVTQGRRQETLLATPLLCLLLSLSGTNAQIFDSATAISNFGNAVSTGSLGGTLGGTFQETGSAAGFAATGDSTGSVTETMTSGLGGLYSSVAGSGEGSSPTLTNNFIPSPSPPPPDETFAAASPPPPISFDPSSGSSSGSSGGFMVTGADQGTTADPNLLLLPSPTPVPSFDVSSLGSTFGSGIADPILSGFDGSVFSFMGQDGKYYNFITDTVQGDAQFQMSVHLRAARSGAEAAVHTGTFIDAVGIKFRRGRFTMQANGPDGLNVTWNGMQLSMANDARDFEIFRMWRFPTGKMTMHWAKYRPGIGNSIVIRTDILLFSFKLVPSEKLPDGTLSAPYINFNTSMVGQPAGTLTGVMGETYDVDLVNPDESVRAAAHARLTSRPHPFSEDATYELPGFFDDQAGTGETRAERSTLELLFGLTRKALKQPPTEEATRDASEDDDDEVVTEDNDEVITEGVRPLPFPLTASVGVVTRASGVAPPDAIFFAPPSNSDEGDDAEVTEVRPLAFSLTATAGAPVPRGYVLPPPVVSTQAFRPVMASVSGLTEEAEGGTWITPEEAGAVDGEGLDGEHDAPADELAHQTFEDIPIPEARPSPWVAKFLAAPLDLMGSATGLRHPCHGDHMTSEAISHHSGADDEDDDDEDTVTETDSSVFEEESAGEDDTIPLTQRPLGSELHKAVREEQRAREDTISLQRIMAKVAKNEDKDGVVNAPAMQRELLKVHTKLSALQEVLAQLEDALREVQVPR